MSLISCRGWPGSGWNCLRKLSLNSPGLPISIPKDLELVWWAETTWKLPRPPPGRWGMVPDAMFHAGARAGYDAAICMYHDQALIPLKTLDFENGVNLTLGLAIVRTSPDHGTALDIAGRGRASAASLIQAIRLAGEIGARRWAAAER